MGLIDEYRRQGHDPAARRPLGAWLLGAAVVCLAVVFAVLLLLGAARPAQAQGLADFDYEHLTIRGAMVDAGWVDPDGVESAAAYGMRLDLGFLGPGVRVTTGFSRWSSRLERAEVRGLESSLEALVLEQTGEEVDVDLGEITLSDVALHADLHMMWQIPFGLLTYAGLGGTAHVMRGSGASIEDTFVDELLDQIRAGVNVHAGLEVPISERIRVVGEGRWELVETATYPQIRLGLQYLWGPRMSGEGR